MRPHVRSFDVVWEFERQVADFLGAKHGIATDSCTSAIFLACKYMKVEEVQIPAKTYVSVPFSVIHAGGRVKFVDVDWSGMYRLDPYQIWDSALRFRRFSYPGGLQCVSFQMKKLLPIGKGGMILTNDEKAAEWLRRARSNGRNASVPYRDDLISEVGWDMAMTPEQAARGMQLLESMPPELPDQHQDYPDLRRMPVFQS